MSNIPRVTALVLFAATTACDANPVDVRTNVEQFPLEAAWNAAAAPVGASTVNGTLLIEQRAGFRMAATLTVNGAANASYQWRIFRGNCATTAVAPGNTSPTGLLLFATVQSYPNVTVNAAGSGSSGPTIAGKLDSLTAYSIRIRVAQTATNWNGTSPIACGNLQHTPAG